MQFHVAAPAHQLQIVPVQGHGRVVDVVRCQVDLVVHDLARGDFVLPQAFLTQPAHAGSIRLTAALPRFAFVKSLCKIFHDQPFPLGLRLRPQTGQKFGYQFTDPSPDACMNTLPCSSVPIVKESHTPP